MGFNSNVLREKVEKIKDRVLETHRGDADANFIDLYAIASGVKGNGRRSCLSPKQIKKLKRLTEHLDMSKPKPSKISKKA